MRCKSKLCLTVFLALLLVGITSFILRSKASETQNVEFEVFAQGDISGYFEETYLVVKTEAEWANVWKKHTAPSVPSSSPPEIDFSRNMVICAFMGERPTAGYNISIEEIWIDGKMHIEIVKRSPQKDGVVAQVLTYPYAFALLERMDFEVVFSIAEENSTTVELVLPEFSSTVLAVTAFIVLSVVMVAVTRKFEKRKFPLARVLLDHFRCGL